LAFLADNGLLGCPERGRDGLAVGVGDPGRGDL
jgi:hypothetical protein